MAERVVVVELSSCAWTHPVEMASLVMPMGSVLLSSRTGATMMRDCAA